MFEMQNPHTGSTGSKTREAHIVQFCTTSTCYIVQYAFGKNTLLLSVTPENDALFLVSSRTAVANIFLFYFFPSITQYLGRH